MLIIKHFKLLWEVLNSRNKRIFILLIFINLLNALLEIASVGALFPIIYSLLSPDSLNSIPIIKNFLENYSPVRGRDFVLLALGITILGFILKNILFGFAIWFRSLYMEKITSDISRRIFHKYMWSSYQNFIQKNTGTVIRNLTHCIELFKSSFLFITLELITHSSIGIAYLVFLTFIDPTLMTYFIIIMTLTMLTLTFKIRKVTKRLGTEVAELNKNRNYYILMGMMGMKEIKALLKESFFIKQFNRLTGFIRKAQAILQFYTSLPRLIIENMVVFLAITAIMILFFQNQSPESIIAKLGVFGFAALKIFPMFSFIASSLSSLAVGGANLEIIHQEIIEDKSSDKNERRHPPYLQSSKIIPFKNKIELKNIHFYFTDDKGEKKEVLNGINLTIKKNTIIGLVGESGSGKTTLVDAIIGFINPQKGEILIDGRPLTRKGVWSNEIGYIPQQIYLSNTSIKENIALGWDRDAINENRIWEVIKTARLDEMVKDLPQGIDTEIGESGVKLSGGQRQRIGIARALYHKPSLLILDEATSALDNVTELEFVNQLNSLKVKTTQIIIAHRLSTIKKCDNIYVLDQGKIVEKGKYSTLEKSGKYFRKMLLKGTKKKSVKKVSKRNSRRQH